MKRNKIYVAITGGIGSGKTTVAGMIAEMGYPVFSADAVARGVYSDPDIFEKVTEMFPQCVSGGTVDRRKLAEEVFSDAGKLAKLNALTHPYIMRKLFSLLEEGAGKVAFAEVPLLFECGAEKDFDRVIVVMRSARARVEAVRDRDGLSEQEVAARMKNQFDYERNLNTGHTVLYNDGDLESLKGSVVRVVHEILGSIRS